MGYESRIYIADKYTIDINDYHHTAAEILAAVNMGCMAYDFRDLFDTEIDYPIYSIDSSERLTHDNYGDQIKSAPIERVISYLESEIKKNPYRRNNPLLQLLKGFNPDEWDELVAIHYGY